MVLDGEEIHRCLRRPIYVNPAYFSLVFKSYRAWKKHGVLQEDGGLQSQPHKLMILLDITDAAVSYCEAERAEKERRNQSRSRMGF